ncbi:hypothetical protein HXX76_013541 [Chlamydomonas incerta]|uniref:Uncharacterized protein n=1 Tax=Chlamydomonas incerta TaxID=51695 RepID=A0A835VU79_CHLIN|nr:hypothetical protein HXX76_013541 [Chlamydomonas incerta]|eukprot:KAG2425699.1 hypothetical protein HXX76_013541 [Chlamydomonas incerta]
MLPYMYGMKHLQGLDLCMSRGLSRAALAALAAQLPQLRGLSFRWVQDESGAEWDVMHSSTAQPPPPPLPLPPVLRLLWPMDARIRSAARIAELMLGATTDGPGRRRTPGALVSWAPYCPLELVKLHLKGLDLGSGELRTLAESLPGL